jgi:ssDNA-binding Zn-finger/Zn-ribbon topoisomerase 1
MRMDYNVYQFESPFLDFMALACRRCNELRLTLSAGNSQSLDFTCPKCSKRLKAGVSAAGRRVKCPQCGQAVRVPGLAAEKSKADDDWLSLDVVPAAKETAPPSVPKATEKKSSASHNSKSQPAASQQPKTSSEEKPLVKHQPAPAGKTSALTSSGVSSANATSTPTSTSEPKHLAEIDVDELALAPLDIDLSPPGPPPVVKSKPKPRSANSPSVPTRSASRPSLFDDDLPDLASLESASVQPPVEDLLKLDGLEELVRPGTARVLDEDDVLKESYRVTCKTCGTSQYVSLDRVGKKLHCPDCHANFVIPPPPPGWSARKKKTIIRDEGPDVPLAPIEVDHHENVLESERVTATDYLDKARRALDDDEMQDLYQGTYDTKGFFQRSLGFMWDPSMILLMVAFGLIFACLFGAAEFSSDKIAKGGFEGAGYLLVLFVGVGLIAVLVAMPMLASGLALLESVANQEKRLSELPNFNVFDNMGEILVIFFALFGSMLPGILVGGVIGQSGGASWMIMSGMMLTCFLSFPVFLLSMLDNGSVFQPLSAAVVKSITQVPEAWGACYLKNMIGFGFVTICWYVLLGRGVLATALGGFLVPWLLFFTCQQMGALANAIADHLSFNFTPVRKTEDGEAAAE